MAASAPTLQEAMLQRVAVALGPELVREVAFVGGCTVGLLVTDAVVREAVRHTDDVDVIVHVLGPGNWYRLARRLETLGFSPSPEHAVLCRTRLRDGQGGELIVDFMPDEAAILGFSNRWYRDALRDAIDHRLADGTLLRVVTPVHFLATKLEAWRGRGDGDVLTSRDVEDILNVIDGRPELIDEVRHADPTLRRYIATEIDALLGNRDFDYAVQSAAGGNRCREDGIFRRLETLATIA